MEVPGTNLAGVLQKLIGWDPEDNLRLRVYCKSILVMKVFFLGLWLGVSKLVHGVQCCF